MMVHVMDGSDKNSKNFDRSIYFPNYTINRFGIFPNLFCTKKNDDDENENEWTGLKSGMRIAVVVVQLRTFYHTVCAIAVAIIFAFFFFSTKQKKSEIYILSTVILHVSIYYCYLKSFVRLHSGSFFLRT